MNAKENIFLNYLRKEVKKMKDMAVNETQLDAATSLLKTLVLDQKSFPEHFDEIAYDYLITMNPAKLTAKL